MVSQLLYGDCYKIIEKRKGWAKIRMEWDEYEGWVSQAQINQVTEEIYNQITASDKKISSDLVNYIVNEENLIFPILIGYIVVSLIPFSPPLFLSLSLSLSLSLYVCVCVCISF